MRTTTSNAASSDTNYDALAEAKALLKMGFYIFPLRAGVKVPFKDTHGHLDATNDIAVARGMLKKFPNCWWGIASKLSGLIIVDIDGKPGQQGKASLARHKAEGHIWPKTLQAISQSGFPHLYYRGPHRFTAGEKSKLYPNIDVPNYVVAPGCGKYRWNLEHVHRPIADAPDFVLDALRKPDLKIVRESSGEPIPIDIYKRMLALTPYNDGPEGLDDRHGYDGWLAFSMACHEAACGEEGGDYEQAWGDWCLDDPDPGPNWDAEHLDKHWCSFQTNPACAASTRGSWFKLLDHFGHHDLVGEVEQAAGVADFAADPPEDIANAEPEANTGKRNRLTPRRLSELRDMPLPAWIVPDRIPAGFTVAYSMPKRGKSFYFMDLALAIACGAPFYGLDVGPARKVLYIAAEGGGAQVYQRMARIIRKRKLDESLAEANCLVIDSTVTLDKSGSVNEMAKLAAPFGPFSLVIVDTLARCMDGDENQTKEMNTAIKGCDSIRAQLVCDLILLHHQGWANVRPRGALTLFAALDCLIKFERDKKTKGVTVVTVEEMRDAAVPETPDYFTLSGGTLDSIDGPVTGSAKLAAREAALRDLLVKITEHGPVKVDAWREAAEANEKILSGKSKKIKQQQFRRAYDTLLEDKFIILTGDGVLPHEPNPADDFDEVDDEE
jgi:AAA domain/Bifunctional DNA primase/polymerase, N-terminal